MGFKATSTRISFSPNSYGRNFNLLWRVVSKRCGFGEQINWYHADGGPIRAKKKSGFLIRRGLRGLGSQTDKRYRRQVGGQETDTQTGWFFFIWCLTNKNVELYLHFFCLLLFYRSNHKHALLFLLSGSILSSPNPRSIWHYKLETFSSVRMGTCLWILMYYCYWQNVFTPGRICVEFALLGII